MHSINLYSRVAYLAQYQSRKIAVESPREQLSYGNLDDLVRRTASLLQASGVARGDKVGLRLRDTPMHIVSMLAVMRLGAVVLPLDWRATRREFDRVVAQFSPKAILNDDSPVLDWSQAIVDVRRAAEFDPDGGPATDAPDGAMALAITSGTTGQPKAMIATHEQTYARCVTRALEGMFRGDDRFMTTLPLAYAAGREHALTPLLLGATLVMFPTLFEPKELVDFVNTRNITAFNLSPNMSRALLGMETAGGGFLMPGIRTLVSTTGKLDPRERAAITGRVVPRVIDYYGSSGTGPIAVISAEADAPDTASVGHVALGVAVEIVEEGGKPVAAGEIGRIRVRGGGTTTAMAGLVENSDEGLREGWYYPGDVGKLDPGGILHLMGRSADLIKRGGLMIHAQEIEQVLRQHPAIIDVAVVGVPSDILGQEVVAFVEARPALDLNEVLRFCRRELAGYKVPSRIEVVGTLPRNASGKVVKASLLR